VLETLTNLITFAIKAQLKCVRSFES